MISVDFGRWIALACAVATLTLAFDARALTAPRAAELGPEVAMVQPSGGFVGQLQSRLSMARPVRCSP